MSDLTLVEKRRLEKFLGMETGYVLNFSNRSFAEFNRDSTGRDIFMMHFTTTPATQKRTGCGRSGRRKTMPSSAS